MCLAPFFVSWYLCFLLFTAILSVQSIYCLKLCLASLVVPARAYSARDVFKVDISLAYSTRDVFKVDISLAYSARDVFKVDISLAYSARDVFKVDISLAYSTRDVFKEDINFFSLQH